MRGVSTAVDVSLAALLVSAALVVVVTVDPLVPADHGTDTADESAELLGATTTSLGYTLAPGAGHADESGYVEVEEKRSPEYHRRTHGSVAGLLARAAVRDASLDGGDEGWRELTHTHEDFERAVRAAVGETVTGTDAEVQVRAVWRPYRGAPLAGRVTVGERPPPGVTVHAASTRVSAPVPTARPRATETAEEGYGAVATVVAEHTVRGLFDPEATWLGLRGDEPVSTLLVYRYRRAADLLGTDVDEELERYDVVGANDRLAAALAERFENDMRGRFETPTAAARNVSTGVVVITVRTWSS